MSYAEIAVDAAAPGTTYTYTVPDGMAVLPGQAVWVPFGRANTPVQGVVFGFADTAPVPALKPISAVIEGQPPLSETSRRLARWLAEYYFAPLFECAALFMPPGFRQRIRTTVRVAGPGGAEERVSQRAERVLAALKERPGGIDLDGLRRRFGPSADGTVEALARRGLVERISELRRPAAGPRFQRTVTLTEAGSKRDVEGAEWGRRPRQRELLQALRAMGGTAAEADLREQFGGAAAIVAALARQGLVAVAQQRLTRDPLAGRAFQEAFAPELTPAQVAAFRLVEPALRGTTGPRRFLLHGVTGSGKTELYLRALQECVAQGRRGIVLVPEIALEPQAVARFSSRFPGRVGVLHSGLSAGEAYDEWWRVLSGEFDVVIGSRSAIFAPQPNLGLIVIDEEHEQSYKQQDPPPRYHARAVAEQLAAATGAVLILGSATPDVETYHNARLGHYRLLELGERVRTRGETGTRGTEEQRNSGTAERQDRGTAERQNSGGGTGVAEARREYWKDAADYRYREDRDRGLPAVEVVDLRQELREGNRSIFSRSLRAALGSTLRDGKQALLFLNRRGSATFIQCRDCGAVVSCARCDIPYTYHSSGERLVCHQCSRQRRVPRRCSRCGSTRIKFLGAGTQRVEKEVELLFPEARVARWDRDAARNREAHERLLAQFAGHEADVLVGTQMIAKGLDLPLVTLVGIVNADVNLYLPDFRAAERTFQLLTQVAGRAGRGEWSGRVVIQTYTPEHYAIAAAARQDYQQFLRHELAFRVRHGYPPAMPLMRLLVSDTQDARARAEAGVYARRLRMERARTGRSDVDVAGPLPAYFRRVRGRYRWQILLKGNGRTLLEACPPPRGWVIDVDPLHVL